jgi:hypothetical protein
MAGLIGLLGAGFSRNWGGWLADEAFEYLIGTPEVRAEPGLRELLWRHQSSGGFENALAELYESFRLPDPTTPGVEYMNSHVPVRSQIGALQGAVSRMFDAMNQAFNEQLEFEQPIIDFLATFDALFTLNQDMLLERLYSNRLAATRPTASKWQGALLPGVAKRKKIRESNGTDFWSEYEWIPDSAVSLSDYSKGELQPIYKLHGSSQWYTADSSQPLLIIGAEKARAIQQFDVLRQYWHSFEQTLSQGPRIAIIGYSFRDDHINEALKKATKAGSELFVIDPSGSRISESNTEVVALLRHHLTGASRRPLRSTLSRDPAERSKLDRFLSGA